MNSSIEHLRYPIGRFQAPGLIGAEQIRSWIDEIELLPWQLRQAVKDFSEPQWQTVYRPGGWSLKQVLHHLADSHMNSYIRFKLAVNETEPTIRPYYEDRWAETADGRDGDPETSLLLLESLHGRWVFFLRSLHEDDFERGFIHPEHGKRMVLKEVLALYAWHGKHHLNHILLAGV